jgi:hypothetical protein
MNIYALTATSSLNCFANKARQVKLPLALAVSRAPKEYSPLVPLSLRAAKGDLPRLVEALLVVHALPQAVVHAKHSLCSDKLQRVRIIENNMGLFCAN